LAIEASAAVGGMIADAACDRTRWPTQQPSTQSGRGRRQPAPPAIPSPLLREVRRRVIPSAVEDVEIVLGVLGDRAELPELRPRSTRRSRAWQANPCEAVTS
jgi:hypothetical protein